LRSKRQPFDCLDKAEQRPQLGLHGNVQVERTAPLRAATSAFVLARTDRVCNGLCNPTRSGLSHDSLGLGEQDCALTAQLPLAIWTTSGLGHCFPEALALCDFPGALLVCLLPGALACLCLFLLLLGDLGFLFEGHGTGPSLSAVVDWPRLRLGLLEHLHAIWVRLEAGLRLGFGGGIVVLSVALAVVDGFARGSLCGLFAGLDFCVLLLELGLVDDLLFDFLDCDESVSA
jgi:hypothetical protein